MGDSIEWTPLICLVGKGATSSLTAFCKRTGATKNSGQNGRARRPVMLTANNAFVNETTIKNTPASRQTGRGKLLLTVRQIGGKAGVTVRAATTATANNNQTSRRLLSEAVAESDRLAAVRSVMIVRGLRTTSM
ncbi:MULTISPECIES: hypothetical protein [Achromobacter]|jgi:hypothetical protein|nr:hypothetical protein [Achromobacter kerstersii]